MFKAALAGAIEDARAIVDNTGFRAGTPSKRNRNRNKADNLRRVRRGKAKRRKANKVARASRRVNRGKAR